MRRALGGGGGQELRARRAGIAQACTISLHQLPSLPFLALCFAGVGRSWPGDQPAGDVHCFPHRCGARSAEGGEFILSLELARVQPKLLVCSLMLRRMQWMRLERDPTLPFKPTLSQGRVPTTSMLVRNYRSHRRLLDLPSKLFYQVCPYKKAVLIDESNAWVLYVAACLTASHARKGGSGFPHRAALGMLATPVGSALLPC